MIKSTFTSNRTSDDLLSRWDTNTSKARFAGADEMLDTVFVAKRKGNRVSITRKPPRVYNPFSPVFRGKITEKNGKAAISGFFTMQLADYLLSFLIIAFYLLICNESLKREGSDLLSAKGLLFFAVSIFFAFITLVPHKKAMNRIRDIIQEIVE